MFFVAVLFFLFILFCSMGCVWLCTQNTRVVLLVGSVWIISQLLWYFYSPILYGNPEVSLSTERDLIQGDTVRNWGNTYSCKPAHIHKVTNIDQLRHIVNTSSRVKVLGGGHVWSPISCTNGTLLTLDWCDITSGNGYVTASAGCSIKEVEHHLLKDSRMLYGLGSIRSQSLAGALLGHLHGEYKKAFAHYITRIHAVLHNGSHVDISDVSWWTNSMGMLGVVTDITLQTFPITMVTSKTEYLHIEDAIQMLLSNENEGGQISSIPGKNQDVVRIKTISNPTYTTQTPDTSDAFWLQFGWDYVLIPSCLLLSDVMGQIVLGYNNSPVINNEVLHSINSFPGYGFIDAGYSVPENVCFEAMREILDLGYYFHFLIRRLDSYNAALSVAPVNSCIIDVNYMNIAVHGYDSEVQTFHQNVEQIILSYGGTPHWGKFWASSIPPQISSGFKQYRAMMDPNDKFLNNYTYDIVYNRTREQRYPPSAINERAFVWRFFIWFNVAIIFLCFASTIVKKMSLQTIKYSVLFLGIVTTSLSNKFHFEQEKHLVFHLENIEHNALLGSDSFTILYPIVTFLVIRHDFWKNDKINMLTQTALFCLPVLQIASYVVYVDKYYYETPFPVVPAGLVLIGGVIHFQQNTEKASEFLKKNCECSRKKFKWQFRYSNIISEENNVDNMLKLRF